MNMRRAADRKKEILFAKKYARPISYEICRAYVYYAAFRICMNSSPVIVSCS